MTSMTSRSKTPSVQYGAVLWFVIATSFLSPNAVLCYQDDGDVVLMWHSCAAERTPCNGESESHGKSSPCDSPCVDVPAESNAYLPRANDKTTSKGLLLFKAVHPSFVANRSQIVGISRQLASGTPFNLWPHSTLLSLRSTVLLI